MTQALDTAIARVRDDTFEANLEFLAQEAWFAGWAAVAEQPVSKFDAFADFWEQARTNPEHARVFRQAQVKLRAPAEASANDDRMEVIAAIFAQPFGAPNLLTDTPHEIAERVIAADPATQRILDLERERDTAQAMCTAWQEVWESVEAHILDRIAMRDPSNPETYLSIIRSDITRVLRSSQQIVASRWHDSAMHQQKVIDLERQLAAMTLARDSAIGMAKDVTERCDLLAEKAQSFLAACAAYGESEADDVRCMLNYGDAKDDLAQTIISGKQS